MKQLALPLPPREEWRDVPGYEGLYQVSDLGRIKHTAFRGGRDGKKYKPGMLKRISPNKDGYMDVRLTNECGKEHHHFVHRLMMLAFCPIENADDLDVNHVDGHKNRNVLSNLEWMTHQQNITHARETLKSWAINQPRGVKAGQAKLTDDKVREIRRLSASGMQQIQIAPLYGVSQVAISKIVHRQTWAHVE